jgi:hypothetical protein
MRKAKYDDVQGAWFIDKQQAAAGTSLRRRPMSAAGLKRPTSNYVKLAAATGGNNLRYWAGDRSQWQQATLMQI